jgi:uncharacterized membrane protein
VEWHDYYIIKLNRAINQFIYIASATIFTIKKIKMKYAIPVILFFLLSTLAGCSVVGGIFKAGIWVGVVVVVAIIALIAYLFSRGKK